ncbi:MAG: hypothetical protein HY298_07485 [Verrucomicrobia bacterium]|nr:hypothetical protein [Verrucomicrobiota bacterium]
MGWIKRNLYFVVGCLVALGLMGWAGWYLYSKMTLNNSVREELTAKYADLEHWNKLNPHPGDGKKVDNIKLAQEQQNELRNYIKKARKYFEKIPAIPDATKVSSYDFARQLPSTIDQMSRDATNASVSLPPGYYFSFQAQKGSMTLAPGSLEPLAVKLGEVKAICELLFRARVNALDGLRRERVSNDDSSTTAGLSDYLEKKSVTNDLAVLTPYELTFRCFSAELAAVMAGFANSPHGFIIKTVNVEPASATVSVNEMTATPGPAYSPQPIISPYPGGGKDMTDRQRFLQRYGIRPTAPPAAIVAPPVSPTSRGGLPTVINEGLIKVTLLVEVVKLKEESKESRPKPRRPVAN